MENQEKCSMELTKQEAGILATACLGYLVDLQDELRDLPPKDDNHKETRGLIKKVQELRARMLAFPGK